MSTNDKTRGEAVSDIKAELVRLQRENENLTAKVRHLESAAASESTLADIVQLADMAYNDINAEALGKADGAFDLAPAGMTPELRPHTNFRVAFEQILDGIQKAIHGFDFGGGDRNGRTRHFDGLVDAIDFHKRRMEQLRVAGDMLVVVEGQKPRLTKQAQFRYDRIVEATELANRLAAIAKVFEEAHHLVSPDEPYLPFEERMAQRQKQKAAQEKAAKDMPDLFAQAGKPLPALNI